MKLINSRLIRLMLTLSFAFVLAACDGLEERADPSFSSDGLENTASSDTTEVNVGTGDSDDDTPIVEEQITSTLTGSVVDGPVIGASIKVYDKDYNLLAVGVSDTTASYSLTITTPESAYPIVVEASGGIDLVTAAPAEFTMKSVMMMPTTDGTLNINPISTLITEAALAMDDGLSLENFTSATTTVLDKFSFGLDRTLVPDPIKTPIDSSNVAAIVKASETMSEAIRRTFTALNTAGYSYSHDDIVEALASDFIDGNLDGNGEFRTSKVIAATTTSVSAQVLTEALTNELRVGGADATILMDQSIRIIQPDAVQMTGSVRISEAMIKQGRLAIQAMQAVQPSTFLIDLDHTLDSIVPNKLPSEIRAEIPADSSSVFDGAVYVVSVSSEKELDKLNSVVRDDEVTEPGVTSEQSPESVQNPVQEPASGVVPAPILATISGYALYMGDSAESLSPTTTLQIGSSIGHTSSLFGMTKYYFAIIAKDRSGDNLVTRSEISGYRVRMGSSSDDLNTEFDLSNGPNGLYWINDVQPGIYYLSVSAYDANGHMAAASNLVQIEVQALLAME